MLNETTITSHAVPVVFLAPPATSSTPYHSLPAAPPGCLLGPIGWTDPVVVASPSLSLSLSLSAHSPTSVSHSLSPKRCNLGSLSFAAGKNMMKTFPRKCWEAASICRTMDRSRPVFYSRGRPAPSAPSFLVSSPKPPRCPRAIVWHACASYSTGTRISSIGQQFFPESTQRRRLGGRGDRSVIDRRARVHAEGVSQPCQAGTRRARSLAAHICCVWSPEPAVGWLSSRASASDAGLREFGSDRDRGGEDQAYKPRNLDLFVRLRQGQVPGERASLQK